MAQLRRKRTTIVGLIVLPAILLLFSSFSTIRSIVDVFQVTKDAESLSKHSAAISKNTLRSNLTSPYLFSKDDIDFKPTKRIPEQKCAPMSSHPRKTIPSFRNYKHIKNLTELTTIRGDYDTPLAICKFDGQGSDHFPHVMQHLYMCYTFWQDNPSRIPVLYPLGQNGKAKMVETFSKNSFLEGFTELLISQLEIKILTHEEIVDWLRANTTKTDSDKKVDAIYGGGDYTNFSFHEMQSPIGYVLSHVGVLNEMAQQYFIFDEEKTSKNRIDHPNDAASCSPPRIRILNRKPLNGRSITNAEYLVQNITSELFAGSEHTPSPSPSLLLTYFEGQAFKEQVRFFQNTDVLISPHGAQLTGIPFLGNKPCTKVIELFPNDYLLPDYFGTLARDSGVEYSYIYFSDAPADTIEETQSRSELKGRIVPSTTSGRSAARKQSLCISPTMIVTTLREVILDWCECKNS